MTDIIKIPNVKTYRNIRIGDKLILGSKDKNIREVNYILDLFPKGYFNDKVVLDIGCAGGALCFGIAEEAKKVVGLEVKGDRIKAARLVQERFNVDNVEFLDSNVTEWLQQDSIKNIDCVFLLNVLHHVENPKKVLKKMSKYVKMICVEHLLTKYSRLGAEHAIAPDELIQLMEEAGFSLKQQKLSDNPLIGSWEHGDRNLFVFERSNE